MSDNEKITNAKKILQDVRNNELIELSDVFMKSFFKRNEISIGVFL